MFLVDSTGEHNCICNDIGCGSILRVLALLVISSFRKSSELLQSSPIRTNLSYLPAET